jgi:hypothetical protein
MRSVFLAAVLLPAAASVAQSQQAHPLNVANKVTAYSQESAVANPTAVSSPRVVDAPIGITRAQALGSNTATSGSTATVDNNTRNTLAIVGAVVIVLALLAFLL